MLHVNKLWIEGYVFDLPEGKYFYYMIQKHGNSHGIKISKCKISSTINWQVKKTINHFLYMERKLQMNIRKIKYCFKSFCSKNTGNKKKNLPTQKSIAKTLNTSELTINKIINQDL